VRVARLHYYPAVRSYLSWLIYQLVILFKILRREDRENICIKWARQEIQAGEEECAGFHPAIFIKTLGDEAVSE
jgi:hypothetical protein